MWLRRTHASHLLATGEDPRTVNERLGHAGVPSALQIFGHVLPGPHREAAEASSTAGGSLDVHFERRKQVTLLLILKPDEERLVDHADTLL